MYDPFQPDTLSLNQLKLTDAGAAWQEIGDSVLDSIEILEVNPSVDELWVTTNCLVFANAWMNRIGLTSSSYTATQVPSWPADQYPKNLMFIGTQWDEGWITVNGSTDWSQFRLSIGKLGYCLVLDLWVSGKSTFYIADASITLPHEVKQRLHSIARNRITVEGILIIEAKRFCTQEQNREDAIARLVALIFQATEKPKPRKKTRPTAAP
jgi:hypothetical protein